ncbi:hypothetical protein L1049_019906 [Liquidambar formosana]|uniref:Uncharacterized protein n=1 Tax=Liquidambar formosana TaxID=63359 RepID=A0AAP0X3A3_LIQFO
MGKAKNVDLGDAKRKEVHKQGFWIPLTPEKYILEKLRPRRKVQKQGSLIPLTPAKPILEKLRPRRKNKDCKLCRNDEHSNSCSSTSFMSNKGKAKKLDLRDAKHNEVQKQGSLIPLTPAKDILEKLRPRQNNENSKRCHNDEHSQHIVGLASTSVLTSSAGKCNAKKREKSGTKVNKKPQKGCRLKKHSKPKVLFEGPGTTKSASIKENLFRKGKNVKIDSFISSALASSSNEVMREAIFPSTPELASMQFKLNHKQEERSMRYNYHKFEQYNLWATNQTGYREIFLKLYQKNSE